MSENIRYLPIEASAIRMPQLALEFPISEHGEPLEGAWASQLSETFRPIHYLGSKLRVVEAISSAIDRLDPAGGAVLDLFSGSGTVAMAMAQRRPVIAGDIQEYSRVICSALLTARIPDENLAQEFSSALALVRNRAKRFEKAAKPLVDHERQCIVQALKGEPEPLCDLLEHGSVLAAERGNGIARGELGDAMASTLRLLEREQLQATSDLTAFRYFGGAYFSFEQSVSLDVIACAIQQFEGAKRDLLLAALLSTASDVVNTVGKQFAQPIRPRAKSGHVKPYLISKIVRDRALDPISAFESWLKRYTRRQRPVGGHLVLKGDYQETLAAAKGKVSVVYADPPYTRDHYSRFYHVLETLALRDNPEIAKSAGAAEGELSRGLYREDRHQSPFCIKSQAREAFWKLFSGVADSGAALVLSYSPFDETKAHPRLMTIDAILELARTVFRNVETQSVEGVAHSKLNHRRLNFDAPPEAEILILCSGRC